MMKKSHIHVYDSKIPLFLIRFSLQILPNPAKEAWKWKCTSAFASLSLDSLLISPSLFLLLLLSEILAFVLLSWRRFAALRR